MTSVLQRASSDNLRIRFYLLAFVIVFGLGLVTLSRSPIPWYDEVFMASISESWLASGKFSLGINELHTEEIVTYGPVYFYLQGNLFHSLGMNIYTVRLPGFLAGIGIVYITFVLLRHWAIARKSALLFCLILSMDHMFGRGMYSGRMDLIAILMILLGLHALQLSLARGRHVKILLLCVAGVLAGLSCVTTPRVIFWLVGLPFFAWSEKDKQPFQMAAVRCTVVILFASLIGFLWMQAATGGVLQYVEYLTNQNQLWHHVGSNSVIRHRSELPIYASVLLGLLLVLKNWKNIARGKRVTLAGLGAVLLSFTLLVEEVGPYESMIIPTYICFIALSTSMISRKQATALTTLLLLSVSFMFFTKKLLIFSEWKERDPIHVFEALQTKITSNTAVLGDCKYFYAVRKNGSKFHSWRQIVADRQHQTAGVTDNSINALLQDTDFAIIDHRKEKDLKAFLHEHGCRITLVTREPVRESKWWDSIQPIHYDSGYPFCVYRLTPEPKE